MNDGAIVYTVGEYTDIDDAKDRKDLLYDKFEESVIIVDDNGTFLNILRLFLCHRSARGGS